MWFSKRFKFASIEKTKIKMQGLSSTIAKRKLQEFGPNVLRAKKANPVWKIFLEQFTDILVLILVGASIISFFVGERIDAIVILFIVLLNAGIGFFQEFRVERTLAALKKMIHPEIRVFRDGEAIMISAEDLVPEDVVLLGEGDKIPADGILREANSLRLDEAVLTGESIPLEKRIGDFVWMGTSVVHGSGLFEVQSTGMNTKFGEIAKLSTETVRTRSPLQKELAYIGLFVTKVTLVICGGLFLVGMLRDFSLVESLLFAVSVAIAAVPEGLPTTITIALALGATVLARRKAIMKKLSSVETLGAVTTICSDKTGTLTRNEMTVREIYLADRSIFHVSGVGYDPTHGKISYAGGSLPGGNRDKLLTELLEICQECNEASLNKRNGRYVMLGDPTEGALLTLVEKSTKNIPVSEDKDIFPFDSQRKMMSVLVNKRVLVKGSPDHVLQKCSHWSDGKKIHRMTDTKRKKIQAHYELMAENALRVLAFAVGNVDKNKGKVREEEIEKNLVFVGLVGMIDPPRSEVHSAVSKCHTAGIRTIVITGDFGITAEAIARELGIVQGNNVQVFTGDEVKKMSDTKLTKLLKDKEQSVIFARSLPDQKMRIVQLLQKQGEVVAMTGDGVNDAPALKAADIGVAMGITGTEVSKEASTMVLTDDSFASIVTAVEEGRRIYENLRKFVWFIFSCNIGELVVVFAAILFNFSLPLTAILILCIDLGTDILPAIALGVDNAEKDLMSRPPRNAKKRLMNKKFVQYFLLIGISIGISVTGAFLWTLRGGGELVHAQTVAFTALVFVQLVNAFSARSNKTSVFKQNPFSNHFLVLAIITSIMLVMLMVYTPFLNKALGTTFLTLQDWVVISVATIIPLIVVEVRKVLVRRVAV
ncbi:HAD-IC family P-type ATPase [Candidatus Gracilibacteria bacterium]|nr:HAD-IC family P-type ATPase [Candidatus Gracilibacteria bacterium]